jgi:hypothetical protein
MAPVAISVVHRTRASIHPLSTDPGSRRYLARRDHGDRHPAALRHLYNRMLGQLYHCLQTGQTYDSIKAYGPPPRLPNKPPLTLNKIEGLWAARASLASRQRELRSFGDADTVPLTPSGVSWQKQSLAKQTIG